MALLNFKSQFVDPIRSGRKHHTIRALRKVPVKRGDKLYLYTGLRQKGAYRILPEPQNCTAVQDITIEDLEEQGYRLTVDGYVLDPDEAQSLAICDGFDSFASMIKFWEGRFPFTGQIIHWKRGE